MFRAWGLEIEFRFRAKEFYIFKYSSVIHDILYPRKTTKEEYMYKMLIPVISSCSSCKHVGK